MVNVEANVEVLRYQCINIGFQDTFNIDKQLVLLALAE